MKTCCRCRAEKPETDFYIRKFYRGKENVLRDECKECSRDDANRRNALDRSRAAAFTARYRMINQEACLERTRKWRKENGDRKRAYRNFYYTTVEKNSVEFRLLAALRGRLYTAVVTQQEQRKLGRTLSLTGCSLPELKTHLEKNFRDGMSWDNYGSVWEIDHIKPCARFDFRIEAHQRECFHYSNLQPLLAEENRAKGSR